MMSLAQYLMLMCPFGVGGPSGDDRAQRQGYGSHEGRKEHPGGGEASLHRGPHLRLPDGREAVSHPGVPERSVQEHTHTHSRRYVCVSMVTTSTCVRLCRWRAFHAAGAGGHLHGRHCVVRSVCHCITACTAAPRSHCGKYWLLIGRAEVNCWRGDDCGVFSAVSTWQRSPWLWATSTRRASSTEI